MTAVVVVVFVIVVVVVVEQRLMESRGKTAGQNFLSYIGRINQPIE